MVSMAIYLLLFISRQARVATELVGTNGPRTCFCLRTPMLAVNHQGRIRAGLGQDWGRYGDLPLRLHL